MHDTSQNPGPDASVSNTRITAASPAAAGSSPLELNLWQRLQEHKVLQWLLAYIGTSMAIAHATELLATAYGWPHIIGRIVMTLLVLGMPFVVTLAWYHGHKGLKNFSAPELTIVGLLLVIAAGGFMFLVRGSSEHVADTHTASQVVAEPAATENKATSSAPAAKPETDTGPSIAVLPFADMSPNHDQEYFADGLAEELLNHLVTYKGLRVIGRTSSFAFKGKNEDLRIIGETLGVNHILGGSVRKAGDRVRITAQLIKPADGSHLWSKTYDQDLKDIFSIQDEISDEVATALAVTLGVLGGEKNTYTRNVEAYDEYLLGRRLYSESTADGVAGGIEHLLRAVEIDPNFGPAWAALTNAYGLGALLNTSRSQEWGRKYEETNNRLQAVAPDSAAAAILASRIAGNHGKWLEAERAIQRVQMPDTGGGVDWDVNVARFFISTGRIHDAIVLLERAKRSDPLAASVSFYLGEAYADAGDTVAALAEFDRGLQLVGQRPVIAGSALLTALATGDRQMIKARARALDGADPAAGSISREMARLADDKQALRTALRRAWSEPANQTGVRGSSIVHWAAYAGDIDLAMDAFQYQPVLIISYAIWRPVLHDVRKDPRFKKVVRVIGLADYWRATGNWGNFCRPVGENDFECQ